MAYNKLNTYTYSLTENNTIKANCLHSEKSVLIKLDQRLEILTIPGIVIFSAYFHAFYTISRHFAHIRTLETILYYFTLTILN